MSQNGIDFPQDFGLTHLDITSNTGKTVNVKYQLVELNIYQDIMNSTVSADLTLNDSLNNLGNLPIVGLEKCEIGFETPGLEPFKMNFRVYKISNKKLVREREQVYTLHLVTDEHLVNLTKRVSKSYQGLTVSDIVVDLHQNWLGGGRLNLVPTKFAYHIIIPNWHPIHAISWLSTKANAPGYGGTYLYYQDSHGFNFVPIEALLSRNSVQQYGFQPSSVRMDRKGYRARDLEADFKAILTYSFDNQNNILENLERGMYGSELLTHDLQNKRWNRRIFNYRESWDEFKHVDEHKLCCDDWSIITPNAKLKFGSEGVDPLRSRPNEWVQQRISQLQQLRGTILTMTVPGDSSRIVGDVVEVFLPSPEPLVDEKIIYDPYFQGRYLVGALRHKIDQHSFVTVMTLIKDAAFSSFPS